MCKRRYDLRRQQDSSDYDVSAVSWVLILLGNVNFLSALIYPCFQVIEAATMAMLGDLSMVMQTALANTEGRVRQPLTRKPRLHQIRGTYPEDPWYLKDHRFRSHVKFLSIVITGRNIRTVYDRLYDTGISVNWIKTPHNKVASKTAV